MKSRAPFWVVDISNSFTKYSLVRHGRLGRVCSHPTPALTAPWIKRTFSGTVALSSVVPRCTALFQRGLGSRLLVLTGLKAAPLTVDYPTPGQIGPDRLANALALRELYGAPGVVLDFGTAVTFDVLNQSGAYCGGVIAPGLNLMTDYLHERTALLPLVKIAEPRQAIAQSTEEAIRAGAMLGYRGLIRGILAAVQKELRVRRHLHVVATGGQAEIVTRGLSEVATVHPHLTLEGVRLWALARLGQDQAMGS